MNSSTIDTANIFLIVLSCVAAHYFPYHLLILSYAILGPAHYLTQISWLHDRQYFANSNWVMPILFILTLLLCMISNTALLSMTFILSLVIALMFIFPTDLKWQSTTLILGLIVAYFLSILPATALFIAILLPTVLHVFVFTAAFMWVGAIKSRQTSAYVALVILFICAATFLLPITQTSIPSLAGLAYFTPIVHYLQSILPQPINSTSLFGFLSYAYTYHYLNWFSKAEIIRWHQIPRRRLLVIIGMYSTAVAVYAYDYTIGFQLLIILSLLHVLLEFPLNLRTFATIASNYASSRHN